MKFPQPRIRVSIASEAMILSVLFFSFSAGAQTISQTPSNNSHDTLDKLNDLVNSRKLPPGVPTLPNKLTTLEVDQSARKAGLAGSQYPFFSPPNGCGPNDWRYKYTPDGTPNAIFIPACINHDICYMTGDSKSECDTNFLYEMTDHICVTSTSSVAGRLLCVSGATAFYKSVDKFGTSAFQNARHGQARYVSWLKNYILDWEKKQAAKSSQRILSGIYWVGATGMGLRVQEEQYQYYDEGGDSPWKSVSELKYIKEGVILAEETYWCLSTLPKPPNTRIAVCSANGWVQAR